MVHVFTYQVVPHHADNTTTTGMVQVCYTDLRSRRSQGSSVMPAMSALGTAMADGVEAMEEEENQGASSNPQLAACSYYQKQTRWQASKTDHRLSIQTTGQISNVASQTLDSWDYTVRMANHITVMTDKVHNVILHSELTQWSQEVSPSGRSPW